MDAVLALLGNERFSEALAALERLPSGADDNATLVRATLLVHTGAVDEAEQLVARMPASADAQYVLALCRESARDFTGALDADHAAVRIDPRFAMPHLHMGMLARTARDRVAASRALALAQALLIDERDTRIALFGGGFTRQALIAMCAP
jgi:chemotaxis protein methyltransferase CheR